MKRSDNAIEFDLNETLYFETGQEIDEMLSISLDPDIAIQTYDDYIQIRGIVLLQGEYKRAESDPNQSIARNENEYTRYIEKVYELNEERTRFSHRFPVEIQIPPYLVENLNDITVSVNAFDYELPDQNTLKIKASIHIDGINNEVEKKEAETTEMKDVETTDYKNEEESPQSSEKVIEMNFEQREKIEEKAVKDQAVDEREQSEIKEMMLQGAEEDTVVQEVMDQEVDTFDQMDVNELEQSNEIDIQLNESATEDDEEVKDVLFLTDLFGGNEEESYTKMRIYITQEDDTIESIAKRYGISALQLMKDNQLSGESLEVGQLLYLPAKNQHEEE